MKRKNTTVLLALSAALLISGCGNPSVEAHSIEEEPAASASEESTTTSVSSQETSDTTTTTTAVSAIGDEADTYTDETGYSVEEDVEENKAYLDLRYGDLIGKPIECENSETVRFSYGDLSMGFDEGAAPKEEYQSESDDKVPVFSFDAKDYRWLPCARISSGALSKECDEDFAAKVNGNGTAQDFSYNQSGFWTACPTEFYFDRVEEDAVYMNKIEYGYRTEYNDNFIVVNAFIRATGEPDTKFGEKRLEFIIDPASMSGLRFPMMGYDPDKMKFEVNGTEFYADTMIGKGKTISYINNKSMSDILGNNGFVYAQVALMGPRFMFNNLEGAYVSSQVGDIRLLTTDTDSVINGSFRLNNVEGYDEYADALIAAKDTLFTDKTVSFELLDLDFDGKPEVIVQYYDDPDDLYGPYATAHTSVYGLSGSSLTKLGDFDMCVDYTTFDEVIYLPENKHGWHFLDAKSHNFLSLENGKLDILEITSARSREKDENGWDIYDYYFLGEKIVVEPYETYNPLKGETDTYYKWVSGNSLGWSVMGFEPYAVYDMLYERVSDMYFKTISKRFVRMKIDMWSEEGAPDHIEPTARFPYDSLDAFFTGELKEEYELYYGLSFEGGKEKPVIYLYPEEKTDVSVEVSFPYGGGFTCTYPEYGNGWNVTAMSDGTLYDSNGDEYYCLYWEGVGSDAMRSDTGFCVAGKDTAAFLREKLMYIGLSAREANEFIIYWLPRMQDNPYNVITLHTDDYARSIPLTVSPAPDSQIRVFMTWYGSEEPVDIPEQILPHYERNGFALVEWGGEEK